MNLLLENTLALRHINKINLFRKLAPTFFCKKMYFLTLFTLSENENLLIYHTKIKSNLASPVENPLYKTLINTNIN